MTTAPTTWPRLTRATLDLTVLLGLLRTAFAWSPTAIDPRNLPVAAVAQAVALT